MTKSLRIATRGSAQAKAQSTAVAEALALRHPGLRVELVLVETLGDQRADVPLHTMGGQGVFVKEVQRAVLSGAADIAVHSAKDLPTSGVGGGETGLTLAAFCERRDPRDALIGATLADLRSGATVATGSVRRSAQLAHVRPDLQFTELRGNIHTRLKKVPPNGALVMAVAALQILDLTDRIAVWRLSVAWTTRGPASCSPVSITRQRVPLLRPSARFSPSWAPDARCPSVPMSITLVAMATV